ncbi:MAG: YihY/virulence factor BrkB family protein [Candidatus Amulumruptor caecigallinarius]|nr:YihY/virulence factor BrkB family protein [Candidatus Amulumruptor caecigallinarius]
MKNTADSHNSANTQPQEQSFFSKLMSKGMNFYEYVSKDVWNDPSSSLKTRIVKIINLTLSSFLDNDLQNKSMALTYSTVLSIVPAFAMLVAIGRGFGLDDILQQQLYNIFPAQSQSVATALKFVDSYLSTTTKGMFVGIGIIVLLWTMISLLSNIEDAFNSIWGIKTSRSFYQKITDYIAVCLIIPVLIICSSGVSFFMTDIIQSNITLPFLTPLVNVILSLVPLVLYWLAFTLSYFIIPNTKVKFKYAAISGLFAAICFIVLQMLFLNGQIYVSKYNAIYGSFAFLPLLLIWLQFSWLLLLSGCMICYSMQNVFTFNLMGDSSTISTDSWLNMALIIMSVVFKRFVDKKIPLTEGEIAMEYNLPIRIVHRIFDKLRESKLVYYIKLDSGNTGISPAVEPTNFTVEDFLKVFLSTGETHMFPDFSIVYSKFLKEINTLKEKAYGNFSGILIKDLPLPTPEEIVSRVAIEAGEPSEML